MRQSGYRETKIINDGKSPFAIYLSQVWTSFNPKKKRNKKTRPSANTIDMVSFAF